MTRFVWATAMGLLLLFATSCQSPNVSVENLMPNASVIDGKIANWIWADTMTISATNSPESFATTRVNSNGCFRIELAIPPFADRQPWGYSHDILSDTSARFCEVGLLTISGPSRATRLVAFNASAIANGWGTPGVFTSMRVFADRPVSIAGFDTLYLTEGPGSPIDTLLVARNIRLVSGWNIVNRRSRYLRENFIHWGWQTEETVSPNWFLQPIRAT
jgi:hypothetical protein